MSSKCIVVGKEELDLLEKRIEILEEQILGDNKKPDISGGRTITDLLLQTQLMVSSALSCREAIIAVLKHVDHINEHLDPSNGDLEIVEQTCYLLQVLPQLKHDLLLLCDFKGLSNLINSSSIAKVTDLHEKLNQLVVENLGIQEEARHVTRSVLKALQQYNDITTSFKTLFAQLELAATDLQIALQPKVTPEE